MNKLTLKEFFHEFAKEQHTEYRTKYSTDEDFYETSYPAWLSMLLPFDGEYKIEELRYEYHCIVDTRGNNVLRFNGSSAVFVCGKEHAENILKYWKSRKF
jgi:hypothetical protein